ncbi:tyrosine-type recombinase/integrase [Pelomonas cellulosilytica]|uniref:tyrosine-type recombinase/integrase n=1 Tax=Pelomonas cellulosilytica TaxID=2906762 RepID=UPI003B02E5D8
MDLADAQDLTAGLIDRLQCPPGKAQAFLRDRKAPTLRVRVTAAGAKSFVFEAKLGRQTIRRTIGDVRTWTIEAARAEANRQRVLIDKGTDPREVERQREEARRAEAAQAALQARTVGEAWGEYVEARRSRWGDYHYRDHIAKAKAGGETAQRGTRGRGETIGGPLYPLMSYRLADLTPAVLSEWAERETLTRPTATRLSWRLLRGFLNWCAEHPDYASVLPPQNPAKAKTVREALGKAKVKQDALLKEQLPAWFAAVRQMPNATASAYLQTLLLVGARPGEWLALRWEDLNLKGKGVRIRDKVEGEREIPLTPYVTYVLTSLPRTNEWVFASPSYVRDMQAKAMSLPHKQHDRACTVAGIDGLTLHGLRRSFKSLTEWLEIPAGVVAQIMGHKPSATAEKHYTVRPLDLLRMHHERIEAWILEQAGVAVAAAPAAVPLRAVG